MWHAKNENGSIALVLAVCVTALTVLFLATGGMKGYGTFKHSPDVEKAVENGQVDPRYRYYHSGARSTPVAVAGIAREYEIDSPNWTYFQATPEGLKTTATAIRENAPSATTGARILDQEGTVIGIVYTHRQIANVRVDRENGRVGISITAPEYREGR